MKENTILKNTGIGAIPEDWKILTLEDATEEIIDYRGKTPKKTTSGIPLITAKIVKNGHILEPEEFISENDYEEWMRRGMPQSGDVIITTEAPMGEVAQLDDRKVALAQRLITLRGKKNLLNNNFLRFILQSSILQNELRKRESGTTVTGIKQSELRKVLLPIPPYPEQKAISDVLLSIDDKIALNRSMNSTLEAIGQALFRRWFVDFEFPDGEGRPYRSSGGEMVETEFGEVPKGWRVKKIGDIVAINEKSIDKQYKKDVIEYVDISSVTVGRLTEAKVFNLKDAPSRAKRIVRHGDTIWSTVRPNLMSFLYIDSPPENLIVSTGFAVLTPKQIPSTFLYYWVTTEDFVNYLSYRADGSAYPAVNTAYIANANIIFPSQDVLASFDNVVSPMQDQIAHNEKQSKTLAVIRNALLPKLMSGEIRVSV